MPPFIKLRFHQVDLHGEPPFAPGQSITVGEGMTVIAGHNGSGKTTFVRRLKVLTRDAGWGRETGMDLNTLEWLVFMEEGTAVEPGEPWLPLKQWLHTHQADAALRGRLGDQATRLWHIMISPFDSRAPHLELRINEDGSIDVMDTSGQALVNRSYNGASDCKELALAVILSVRKIWRLDLPLVGDGLLEVVSSARAEGMLRCIRIGTSQSILTVQEDSGTDIPSTWQICHDNKTGLSILAAVTTRLPIQT